MEDAYLVLIFRSKVPAMPLRPCTGPGTKTGKGRWARRTKDMVRGVGRERGGNLICRAAAGRGGRGLLLPPALLRARDQSVVRMLVSCRGAERMHIKHHGSNFN